MNNDKCFECDSTINIHHHHIVPKSCGGKRTLPLCERCHGLVHDKDFVTMYRLQREGVDRAKKEGKFIGRIRGSIESREKFRAKPKIIHIKNLLKTGHGIREIVRTMECSPNLIYKVKKFYNL